MFFALKSTQKEVLDEWKDLLEAITFLQSIRDLEKASEKMKVWKRALDLLDEGPMMEPGWAADWEGVKQLYKTVYGNVVPYRFHRWLGLRR